MKLKSSLIAVVLCFAFYSAKAQTEQGQSVVTAGVGYSLTNAVTKALFSNFDDIEVSAIPPIGVTFDHGLSDRFSLGAAVSFQNLTVEYSDSSIASSNQNVTASVTRMNFALRPLLHYGASEKLDLYSGFRLGILSNSVTYESDDPDYGDGSIGGSRLSLGLALFGMRYYVSDQVGLNLDIQLGVPYVFSAGVAARF